MNDAADAVVIAENLRKTYRSHGLLADHNEIVAVDDVTFRVPSGGSLAIVGESGAGKSTIARLLLGIERATSGTICVAGRTSSSRHLSRKDRKQRARDIQIVFQDPYLSLDPQQSVGASLGEVIKFHFGLRRSEREARVTELLDHVGLSSRVRDELPRQLSGGQRQRVAIARALAVEPIVLVLDEAVASLDVSIQAQILNLLIDLRSKTSIAYVFISHDLGVVRQISDEVLVMREGKLVEQGLTERVLDDPQHPYTKLLLACVPGPGWKPPVRGELGVIGLEGKRSVPSR